MSAATVTHDCVVLTDERVDRSVYTAECSGCGWIGETRVSKQRANRDRDEHLAGVRGVPVTEFDRPVGALR